MRMRQSLVLAALAWLALWPACGSARADEGDPVQFTADEVSYDQELGLVTARGSVEIVHEGRILLADQISYNSKRDTIAASGNVSLTETTGEVYFADYFELSGDFMEAVGKNLRVLLADRSRLAAATGRRISGDKHEMERAVYSACEVCKEDPSRPLVWQVKAMKVTHDEDEQVIEYQDAWLEAFGFPVAYTPYFSHADPRSERRSGFLTPSFGGSGQLGGAITVPYYFAISPHEDATVAPMFTVKEGVVMTASHRKRFQEGKTETQASITHDSRDHDRGHIRSKGRFDLDDNWRTGFDIARTTDRTYLRRYGFRSDPWLETRPFVEGFGGRSYANLQAYAYQGMRAEDRSKASPLVLPMADYNYVSEPGAQGQYVTFDAGALALTRDVGTDMRRLSSKVSWVLPYTAPKGDIYRMSASLRGEGYHVNNYVADSTSGALNGATGRVAPELAMDWRWPFIRHGENYSDTIEPIVVGVVSPNGMNPRKIPNEDSLDFEYDDTNIFRTSRFSGLDRFEGGPRVGYGVKWSAYGRRPGSVNAMLGQSYKTHKDSLYGRRSGMEDRLSDYVGRVEYFPGGNLSLLYRFRVDRENFTAQRNEIGATVGPKAFNIATNYMFVERNPTSGMPGRNQVSLVANSAMTQYWSAGATTVYNVGDDSGPLSLGFRLLYNDECFAFQASYTNKYTSDSDYKGGQTVLFRFVLKTLGEVQARAQSEP
jgi:LPS-assembly protein